jgi:hypothetical protein
LGAPWLASVFKKSPAGNNCAAGPPKACAAISALIAEALEQPALLAAVAGGVNAP